MYRCVSLKKLAMVAGDLQVALPLAQPHIADTAAPSLNSDLSYEAETHANTQSGK
jgi:hypothetical protein